MTEFQMGSVNLTGWRATAAFTAFLGAIYLCGAVTGVGLGLLIAR